MADAVAAYAGHLDAAESWMLGRFVVPAGRLEELAAESARYTGARAQPWRVAVLVGDDAAADLARVTASNATHVGRLLADVVELRAATAAEVRGAAALVGDAVTAFVELPVRDDPRALLAAVRDAGARAKIRTGGVEAAAFPSPAEVARFIVRCAELGVPFKATAGLHHPLRAEHPLTYAPDAPRGTMFGFLNVFAAAAFAQAGAPEPVVVQLLEERDAGAMRFEGDVLRWRDETLDVAQLRRTRETFALSFGSCSFREPVDDLHQLGLL